MNLKLEAEFSKAEIFQEVGRLKKQIDDMHPLPEDVEGRVMQKLRLDWNYHSNAIEGNRLTYGETIAFLMEGITAKGKPLKDHLDIRGHNEAINFLLSIVKDTRPISEVDIRNLHRIILVEPYEVKAQTADGLPTTKRITLGEYKTSPNHVKTATGEIHYYATPEETPAKMQELMEWYTEAANDKAIHPVVTAALFHHKFVSIHPFDDGNGRLSRILMNLILMQNGYPPVVIKMDDRQNYYALLSRADNKDNWPFVEYIAERLTGSLQLYLKAASGGDIDEDEDIDKEIALLKMELKNEIKIKEKRSNEIVKHILNAELDNLIIKINVKSREFDQFFFGRQILFKATFDNGNGLNFPDYSDHFKFLIKKMSEGRSDLRRLTIDFNFTEFKDPFNNFNITCPITILFDVYDYKVLSDSDGILICKYYHEVLNPSDISTVIKSFIYDLKKTIEVNLKTPK